MLNRIKAAIGTMAITGMLVLPTWAQSPFPLPQPPPPGSGCPNVVLEQEPNGIDQPQDVGIVDQYGNTHWLEKVRFLWTRAPDAPAA